ncbi:MAG TPA: hypothetical protein EYO59_05365, partial [Chromatiaceae bacterium]|nr:hypothetical protein [Chromatiaceae bacterium]
MEDIEVNPQDGRNFWQIRNGYGKTTTLLLLRHIFTGNQPNTEELRHFKYNQTFGGDAKHGKFCVDLEIQNPSHPEEWDSWTVSLHIDNSGHQPTCYFETISPELGGPKDGWHLPESFKSHFENKSDFIELFIFDGETAKELCTAQGTKRITRAIRDVSGLGKVFKLIESDKSLFENIFDEEVRNQPHINSAGSSEALQSLGPLKDHIASVEISKLALEDQLEDMDGQILSIVSDLKGIDAQTQSQGEIKNLETKIEHNKTNIKSKSQDLIQALANPSNLNGTLWDQVSALCNEMLRSRIPETVGQSFFNDLLRDDTCICGLSWNSEMKAHVESRVNDYLGDDILSAIRTMQNEVEQHTKPTLNYGDIVSEIKEIQKDTDEMKTQLTRIREDFDEDLASKREELLGFKFRFLKEKDEIKEKLQEIEETDEYEIQRNRWDKDAIGNSGPLVQVHRFTLCKNLKSLLTIKQYLNERASATDVLRDLRRGINTATEVIEEALDTIMEQMRQELKTYSNEILSKIPGAGGPLFIDFNQGGLEFYNQHGERQPGANIGANVSAAYSFIAALGRVGNMDVPMFVDSPTTGLDAFSIRGWSENIVPEFGQFIAFIHNVE